MNLDLINRGVSPNDGTGDTLRDGAGKINDNFTKLLAAHASQSGNPVGGLQLTDVLTGFRPDNPSDRTEGGVDFGVAAQALLNFVAANLSTIALPVTSWTPVILGSSADPTATYAAQVGFYVRIGNLVFVSARINWSALSGGSGNARFSLPVAGAGDGDFSDALATYLTGVTFPAGITSAAVRVRPGGAPSADLLGSGSGAGGAIGLTNLNAGGSVTFSGLYRI